MREGGHGAADQRAYLGSLLALELEDWPLSLTHNLSTQSSRLWGNASAATGGGGSETSAGVGNAAGGAAAEPAGPASASPCHRALGGSHLSCCSGCVKASSPRTLVCSLSRNSS